MPSLSILLRRALARVNGAGKSLAIGVALWGVVLIALQSWLAFEVGTGILAEMREIVGEQRFEAVTQEMGASAEQGRDIEEISDVMLREISGSMETMNEKQRTSYMLGLMGNVLRRSFPGVLFAALLLVLFLGLSRAYFQVLAVQKSKELAATIRRMLQTFLPLVGSWIGVALCSCLWLPGIIILLSLQSAAVSMLVFPAVIPIIALLPRFYFAPYILLQEGKSIRESLAASYKRTTGRYVNVLWVLVGGSVVVWMATTLAQSLLQALVQTLLPYSIVGFTLYGFMPLITLIAVAYKSAYAVEVTSELK